ncbi:hypothetical protein AVEN_34563-1 [Araneus ventricosus]|uniref:Uncharacterized protein n=1 Tax=Araneus ventricosus TaxID=182803 RepID=A0A4Y2AZ43_ARAVE|nr:hypothetical protein AVEN_34563-1 [Araneus ventricosus]
MIRPSTKEGGEPRVGIKTEKGAVGGAFLSQGARYRFLEGKSSPWHSAKKFSFDLMASDFILVCLGYYPPLQDPLVPMEGRTRFRIIP